ncbi:unnamed protein product [Cuscuta campestris]|uniref:Multiprotein bridging factor 1 N-terminal domain-containing protein n=1 Tax=Cuscuta campestris TaxID=132261 RepID=A0A484KK93_9ASTE|nr:unnamed protein product [Cuscuta campestris]
MNGPIRQDWEPVVIRKKAPTAAANKDKNTVNLARRVGAKVETVKKSTAGTNKTASSSTTLNTRKLDEETENLTHEAGMVPNHKIDTQYEALIISTEAAKNQDHLTAFLRSLLKSMISHVDAGAFIEQIDVLHANNEPIGEFPQANALKFLYIYLGVMYY